MEKQKKCTTCKKKVVKQLESVIEEPIDLDTPTLQDIKIAYAELTSYGGIKSDKKEFIKNIYTYIFKEELDLNCRGCGSIQVQKFTNYLNKNNIKV
jgi:predicted nucleotidyltransferase